MKYVCRVLGFILWAALIMGCSNPMSGSGFNLPSSNAGGGSGGTEVEPTPPIFFPDENPPSPVTQSKGVVRITVGSSLRTILPPAGTTPSTIAEYRLVFTDSGSANVERTLGPSGTGSVEIPVGTYSLTVYALRQSGNANSIIASGDYNGTFSIAENESKSLGTIQLNYDIMSGNTSPGTFNWNITIPADVTGTMVITGLTINSNVVSGVNPVLPFTYNIASSPSTNTSGTRQLDPGYYRVDFALKKTYDPHTVYLREMLHIYQDMASGFTYTFAETLFPEENTGSGTGDVDFDILFNFPGEFTLLKGGPGADYATLVDNSLTGGTGYTLFLNKDRGNVILRLEGATTLSNYEWFVNGTTANTETFTIDPQAALWASPKMLSITAYEASVPKSASVEITVVTNTGFNIIFEQLQDYAPDIAEQTIHIIGNPKTYTYSVANPGSYASIAWSVDGGAATGSGASFTIDSSNNAYNAIAGDGSPGKHSLMLTVVRDGMPYNKTIYFYVSWD